ncbi:MAG: PucR family transcriptional regulator, partial [Lachnospiraceae bacterium]
MISNQVLQATLDGLKTISRVDLCVLDTEGIMLATTFAEAEDFRDSVLGFVDSPADSQVVAGCQFYKVFDEHQLEYILLANGNSDDVHMVGRMAAFQLQNLLVAYKERFDKDNFIKNLLLDNLLLVDIYNRAKKLHIDTEARRVVFILEIDNERENSSLETVRCLFNSRSGDFITAVDEHSIIVVKELAPQDGYAEMDKIAEMILDSLGEEKKQEALIAYGTIVGEIKEVSRSYKE